MFGKGYTLGTASSDGVRIKVVSVVSVCLQLVKAVSVSCVLQEAYVEVLLHTG